MILDEALMAITHPLALVMLGLTAHFLRKMASAAIHDTEHRPCVTDLWKLTPIQTCISIVGAFAGYAMFAHFPRFLEMAPDVQNTIRVTAFGIGYMADNVVDMVGNKAMAKMQNTP